MTTPIVIGEPAEPDTAIIVEAAVDAALADHKADMAVETADEALAVAEVALAVAGSAGADDGHVCRCDEIEARVVALEATTAEVVAEVDDAITEAIVEAEATDVAPAPPVKEKPAPAAEATEETPKSKRSGMSKGWFGARAK